MMEFGKNHRGFDAIAKLGVDASANPSAQALRDRLASGIDRLDLSDFQKESLASVQLDTIGSVLQASEADLQKANYVGPVRARQIMNTAQAAVLEYLSG
jgi:DNA-directed RNA polymerase alpha subunit